MIAGARAQASGTPRWQIAVALAIVYVVWGSTYLAIRVMVETVPALLGAGLRFLLAGALMCGWLVARRGFGALALTGRQAVGAGVVGTLLLAGGNGLVTIAEQDVPSGLAALVIASVPLWVVVLRRVAGERVARGTFTGVALGFLGVALLMLPGSRPSGASLTGALLLVVAAASWASGSFSSGRLPLPRDPLVSTGIQMLLGGAVLAVAGLVAGEAGDVSLDAFSTDSALAWAYLVTIGSLVAFTAYVWLLQRAPISLVATYAYVNPVVAVLLGWAILSEEVSPLTALAATVIVASVALVVGRETGPEPAPAAEPESVAEPAPVGGARSLAA